MCFMILLLFYINPAMHIPVLRLVKTGEKLVLYLLVRNCGIRVI